MLVHVVASGSNVSCEWQVQTCADILVRQAGPCASALGVSAKTLSQPSAGMEVQHSGARMLHNVEWCQIIGV